ncbi:hypothetical protein M0804_014969, partial [Polistes exclamans]
ENDSSPSSNSDISENVLVKDILSKINPSAHLVSLPTKIGRKCPNRIRPVRIFLASKHEVLTVLKNKFKYRGPVHIRQDNTNIQRDHLKSLKRDKHEDDSARLSFDTVTKRVEDEEEEEEEEEAKQEEEEEDDDDDEKDEDEVEEEKKKKKKKKKRRRKKKKKKKKKKKHVRLENGGAVTRRCYGARRPIDHQSLPSLHAEMPAVRCAAMKEDRNGKCILRQTSHADISV